MTTIADRLAGADTMAGSTSPTAAGRLCRFAKIVAGLDDTDRTAVIDAVARPGYSDERVALILTREVERIHAATVRRHRVGSCGCPTTSKEATP